MNETTVNETRRTAGTGGRYPGGARGMGGVMDEVERSPEYRLVAGLLRSLRRDLTDDAFAYRPLGPVSTDLRLIRWLPGRLREKARWTPHALVLAAAALVVLIGLASGDGASLGAIGLVLAGLLPALPVVLTLTRPIGAWWLSVIAAPVTAVVVYSPYDRWPWTGASFVGHLTVMVVVACRTKPRIAVWMWLLTLAEGFVMSFLSGTGYIGDMVGPFAVVSAFALLLVTVVHTRRTAKQEITAQRSVTEVERERRTTLEERTTIARELHDVVAHHMSVVAIQAEAAPYRVENPPPELEQAFVTIRENAVAALTELRRILGVVRAEDYEAPDAPQPTLADLGALLANVREAGLTVEKTVTGFVRELPQGVELSAYRIIQEALSNVLRHAPGAQARVELSYVLGGLGLRIVNGMPKGLVKPSPGAGHGIKGMRERVAMLGGEMTNGPVSGAGYQVTVFIPLPGLGAEPESGAEPETVSLPEPAPVPVPETVSLPVPEPETVSLPVPEPETVSLPEPAPVPEPETASPAALADGVEDEEGRKG